MRERSRTTIGLDLGDEWSHACVLDEAGVVVERDRVRTTPEALTAWFGKRPPARVAMEAGTHSPYASRTAAASGHEALVANPRRLRLIYGEHTKSDQVDAETLARLARVDPRLLSSIEHRTERQQADRELLRARDALVRTRTDLVNHVRGAVKPFGSRLPSCTPGPSRGMRSRICAAYGPFPASLARATLGRRAHALLAQPLAPRRLRLYSRSAPRDFSDRLYVLQHKMAPGNSRR